MNDTGNTEGKQAMDQKRANMALWEARTAEDVRRAFKAGANPNFKRRMREHHGMFPALFRHADPQILTLFAEVGVNLDIRDAPGNSLVHRLCSTRKQHEHPDTDFSGSLHTAIRLGFDVNARNRWKDTPMHLTSFMGSRIGEILLRGGAHLETENDPGMQAWQTWLSSRQPATDDFRNTARLNQEHSNPNTMILPDMGGYTGDELAPARTVAKTAEDAAIFLAAPENQNNGGEIRGLRPGSATRGKIT